MGRAPCCEKNGLKKGPWTPEEDQKLIDFIQKNGYGNWTTLPKNAELERCGKSCRLRWTNYLRPGIKRGRFSFEEEETIIQLHSVLGNKWSAISTYLPGRTDNEIKNYWNTHIRKRRGLVTHSPRLDRLDISSILSSSLYNSSYSLQSLHSTEFTLNSTCRKPVWPSWNRRNRVNESDQAKPESSFSINECAQRADLGNGFKDLNESEQSSFGNSETGSTKWEKRLGYMISANEAHILILNQPRTQSSHSDGPLSEASATVAHNAPPCTPVSDVESMNIKVIYVEEDMIIKFNLPTSSSKEDLVKEVIMRMGDKLKDKAFDIKYLDDVSLEPSLLISTDMDWQECIVRSLRTTSREKKLIRTVIELQKDV